MLPQAIFYLNSFIYSLSCDVFSYICVILYNETWDPAVQALYMYDGTLTHCTSHTYMYRMHNYIVSFQILSTWISLDSISVHDMHNYTVVFYEVFQLKFHNCIATAVRLSKSLSYCSTGENQIQEPVLTFWSCSGLG